MGDSFKRIRVAAVHTASVFLDCDACVEKVCGYIKQCAAGARLIVFPETYTPSYPSWTRTRIILAGSGFFQRMYANSVAPDGIAIRQLGASARAGPRSDAGNSLARRTEVLEPLRRDTV